MTLHSPEYLFCTECHGSGVVPYRPICKRLSDIQPIKCIRCGGEGIVSMARISTPFRKASMSIAQAEGSRGDGGASDRAMMEERDRRFVYAIAHALQRGDHLPKGTVKPLLLVG